MTQNPQGIRSRTYDDAPVMGKASFVELQDSKGRIQVYITRDDICREKTRNSTILYLNACST